MKRFALIPLAVLALSACNQAPANMDPKQGVVWTVPNKTAWKQCDGTTMLWGKAEKGAPYGRWVTATQPNATECM